MKRTVRYIKKTIIMIFNNDIMKTILNNTVNKKTFEHINMRAI